MIRGSAHLCSPASTAAHLIDIEPAGCPAARPGVVVSPEVVASQGSVEHAEGWLLAVPLYLVDCRLTPKQIFVQGMKYNVKVC